jgi:hypothetical protein
MGFAFSSYLQFQTVLHTVKLLSHASSALSDSTLMIFFASLLGAELLMALACNVRKVLF